MNNGKQFIEAVCQRLREKKKLLHDYTIVSEIGRMRWNEIMEMCAAEPPNNGMEPTYAPTFTASDALRDRVCEQCTGKKWSFGNDKCVSCKVTFSEFVWYQPKQSA